jgi:hypothetical protein
MFLSVVILGGFTTETHAMVHSISADTPNCYLHHVKGRIPGGGPMQVQVKSGMCVVDNQ